MSKQVDAHPLVFFFSFHTLIALMHPLHGNPYSLTLISSDGHLHSPLICLVDVRLSPFFLFTTTFYSTYSAISMDHAHVLREELKFFKKIKSMKQLLD